MSSHSSQDGMHRFISPLCFVPLVLSVAFRPIISCILGGIRHWILPMFPANTNGFHSSGAYYDAGALPWSVHQLRTAATPAHAPRSPHAPLTSELPILFSQRRQKRTCRTSSVQPRYVIAPVLKNSATCCLLAQQDRAYRTGTSTPLQSLLLLLQTPMSKRVLTRRCSDNQP